MVAGSTERIGAISPARESGAYCVGAVGERAATTTTTTTSPQLESRRVSSPPSCASSAVRLALPCSCSAPSLPRDSPRLATATRPSSSWLFSASHRETLLSYSAPASASLAPLDSWSTLPCRNLASHTTLRLSLSLSSLLLFSFHIRYLRTSRCT